MGFAAIGRITDIETIGIVVAWLGAVAYLLNQVRKPSQWLGRAFLKDMNRRHSGLTDWGLAHVEIGGQLAILDVGCGGGRTLEKLAGLAPQARIYGIDYAAGSVAESRARNAGLIAAGRVDVIGRGHSRTGPGVLGAGRVVPDGGALPREDVRCAEPLAARLSGANSAHVTPEVQTDVPS